MIAVSNTTPVRYLIAIRQESLFEKLFGQIVIPTSVFGELTHPRTPEFVRTSVSGSPPWLVTRPLTRSVEPSLWPHLHRGEREAIALAETLAADVLIIDEKYGRAAARDRGPSDNRHSGHP